MRISFVSANRQRLPDAVIPLGLLQVMANLPERHDKRLVDLLWEAEPLEVLAEHLAEFQPELVCVGLRNLQSNDYSGIGANLAWYRQVMEAIRATSSAPVILGGAGFSVMPERLMEELRPDHGIAGEGEHRLAALVEALEGEGSATPGLQPAAPPFTDFATLRAPGREAVDPRYYATVGIDSVQTKRGCPLGCTYCTYPKIEGRRYRMRDPGAVVDELEAALAQRSPSHFFLVDSIFNLPRSHAAAVCEELVRRDWQVPWTCYAHPAGFDPDLAALMRRAGCTSVEIGSDSGSDRILQRLHKGFTAEQIQAAHQVCADAGILDCHTWILGTPGEDLSDVEATLDLIDSVEATAHILGVWQDEAEAFEPELARQRLEFRQSIDRLLQERARPRWVVQHLGINYNPRVFRILRRAGRTGPLWMYLRD